jgi:hypothetical protein
MHRRDFLKAVSASADLLTHSAAEAATGPKVIGAFDYRSVRLGDSRWRKQVQDAREYYLAISDDDILHGFRAAAGLAAPGKPLGGWCREDSSTVFGQ